MSAIREVVETATIPLNPSHVRRHHYRLLRRGSSGFHVVPSFPANMINNQKDKRHVEDIWTKHVCPTITKLCYARTSPFINKNIRKTAFHSSMSNICSEFNRKTLNVKVEFQIINVNSNSDSDSSSKTTYALRFSRLSDISDSILNNAGQYCTAEIPDRPPDPVEAELIGPSSQEQEQEQQQQETSEEGGHTSSASSSSSDAVGIVIDVVEDYSHQTTRTRTRTTRSIINTINNPLPAVVINNSSDTSSLENLPILSADAVVILDDNEQAAAIIREEEMIRMMNNGGEPPIVTTATAYVEDIP